MFEVRCLVSERLLAIGNTAQRTADSGKRIADRSRLLAPSSRLPAFGCPLSHCPTVPLSHCHTVTLSHWRRLPADRYLQADGSLSACTKILLLRLRMTVSGGRSRNAVFVFMAEGDTTTLGPKGRSPLLHNLTPSGGYNPRGQRPRPPSPLNPLNLGAQRAHHYPTGTGLPFVIYFH